MFRSFQGLLSSPSYLLGHGWGLEVLLVLLMLCLPPSLVLLKQTHPLLRLLHHLTHQLILKLYKTTNQKA